jgi:flagellin
LGLRINTNTPSIAAQRALESNSKELSKTLQHLSSGSRITSASEDAAGLSISDHLRGQVRSLQQANRNANDGVSLVQVAEGGLNEVSNILVRLRELSIQAASDTIGEKERSFVNQEFQALKSEIDRIAAATNFSGTPLLNGEAPKGTLEFQVGAYNTASDRISFRVDQFDTRTDSLGIDGSNTQDIDGARNAIGMVDRALDRVNGYRASLGALQNRLNSTSNSLSVAIENMSAAASRVKDADIAVETANLAKQSILKQAGIAVLAQANQEPAMALKLI